MTKSTDKLAWWRLRRKELDFDLVARTIIKHEAASTLSPFKIRDKEAISFNDVVPVHPTPQESFACRSTTEAPEVKPIVKPKAPFSTFLRAV